MKKTQKVNAPYKAIIEKVQVNIPFEMLMSEREYLDLFFERELNPEIGIDGAVCLLFA